MQLNLQVPGVAAAAVVGLPHSRLGEQVHVPAFCLIIHIYCDHTHHIHMHIYCDRLY